MITIERLRGSEGTASARSIYRGRKDVGPNVFVLMRRVRRSLSISKSACGVHEGLVAVHTGSRSFGAPVIIQRFSFHCICELLKTSTKLG
jgi:hypothetical protein